MPGKILVTGGTGFLGAYIIRQLKASGYIVRATTRTPGKFPAFTTADWWKGVEWFETDLLDVIGLGEAMEEVDGVIHAAGKVSFNSSDKKELYATNVEGTANVVNLALELNVPRLVHVSSVAALGRTEEGEMVSEKKEWQDSKDNTHYAISKHKGEMEVWRAIGEGLNAVILNPSTIIGFGDWNTSSCAIFKKMYDGFPYYTGGANGFVDVEDVAKIAVEMLGNNISAQRYIVNGDNWSFKQLLQTMWQGFGHSKPMQEASAFICGLAWRADMLKSFFTGKKSLLTKGSAHIAQSSTLYDNRKILQALPDLSFTSLQESILNSCRLYLQQVGAYQGLSDIRMDRVTK